MKYIIIIFLFFFCSCDITKQKSSQASDTDYSENIKTKTYRPGDTAKYTIPIIRYKDTLITTITRQGTVLNTVYDKNGNIDIECISSKIEEQREENRRFQQEMLAMQKDKTEKFNDGWIMYIVIGLLVFLLLKK